MEAMGQGRLPDVNAFAGGTRLDEEQSLTV